VNRSPESQRCGETRAERIERIVQVRFELHSKRFDAVANTAFCWQERLSVLPRAIRRIRKGIEKHLRAINNAFIHTHLVSAK
jgi:hypothetical protein